MKNLLKNILKLKSFDNKRIETIFFQGNFVQYMKYCTKKIVEGDLVFEKELRALLRFFKDINICDLLTTNRLSKDGKNKFDLYIDRILSSLIEIYRNGIKCSSRKEDMSAGNTVNEKYVVRMDKIAKNYYLYIYCMRIIGKKSYQQMSDDERKMYNEYISKKSEVENDFFYTVQGKFYSKIRNSTGADRLRILNKYYGFLNNIQKSDSRYLRLLASRECLKFTEFPQQKVYYDAKKFIEIIKECTDKIKDESLDDEFVLDFLKDIFAMGVEDCFGRTIIKKNDRYANFFETYICKQKADEKIDVSDDVFDEKKITKAARTYVCSDLHGQYEVYQKIISQLGDYDTLYIIGDVIDRGKDGIKILQDLIKRKDDKRIQLILGNHEIWMIHAIIDKDEDVINEWTNSQNGGSVTYDCFYKLLPEEQLEITKFLVKSLVAKNLSVNGEKFQLVHASTCPNFESEEIYVKDYLLSDDDVKLDELEGMVDARNLMQPDENVRVVVGHTPTISGMIENSGKLIKIDCGAANPEHGNVGLLCLNDMSCMYYSVRECSRANKQNVDMQL